MHKISISTEISIILPTCTYNMRLKKYINVRSYVDV